MAEHIVPLRVYYGIYLALIVLTGVTVTVALVDLGLLNPVVAMTIAILKALLVVLFFMHARHGPKLVWVVAAAALFWLGILFVLTLSDYLTRGWSSY